MNPDQHPKALDETQPSRRSRPDATGPSRRAQLDVTQPARRASRPPAPRPAPEAQRRPRQSTTPRRRWRGYLLRLLALALLLCLGGVVVYGLLMVPPPTNILILGVDRRPGEGEATRTDTILLLHVAPRESRLVMLSIPRDLWVTIPGRGQARINTAHVYGELEAAGSGPARTAETIGHNFGVSVHRTLRLDFEAFRQVIDAAGGIEIDVSRPIIDDAYPTADYGTMRIEIPAGRQHMDGTTALQYARSRHSSSDFDRAARQQQVLVALAKKLTSPGGWPRAPHVYAALQAALDGDLSPRDLARLALAWQRAGEGGIDRIVIDRTMTSPFRTANGAAVLLPRWELIQPLVQAEFSP